MDNYKKKLKEWYNSIADRYDSWGERDKECAVGELTEEIKQFNKFLDLISISPNTKILDVGTGTGIYLLEILKRGGEGFGIDISDRMLDILRKKIEHTRKAKQINELKVGEAAKLEYPDNFFDIIICMGVFDYYHFNKVRIFLREMIRVGKNEAYIIVDFPNIHNKKVYEFQEKERSIGHEVHIHKTEEIIKFLKLCRLEILAKHNAGIEIQFLLKIKKNDTPRTEVRGIF